jgi:hypothetical protein
MPSDGGASRSSAPHVDANASTRHARQFCLAASVRVRFSQVRTLRRSDVVALRRMEIEVVGTSLRTSIEATGINCACSYSLAGSDLLELPLARRKSLPAQLYEACQKAN